MKRFPGALFGSAVLHAAVVSVAVYSADPQDNAEPVEFSFEIIESRDETELQGRGRPCSNEDDPARGMSRAHHWRRGDPASRSKDQLVPASNQPISNLKPQITDPAPKNRIRPVYPRSARRRGYEGKVVISARISATGVVGNVAVVESSGYLTLDEAAVKAVREAEFEPACCDGTPIERDISLVIEFRIKP